MPKKLALAHDVVRNVGSSPLVYTERVIADNGWRIVVIGKEVLVSLQRTALHANEVEFRTLLSKTGLTHLCVGAKTAKEMGIARWVNIELIPERVYESLIAAVIANANADVLEAPFNAFMEEMKREVESVDTPETH